MKQNKYLFIDRDGTLIVEPPIDKQVDSIEKLEFFDGVFEALKKLQKAGFKLVMVSNQDGLGTDSFPQADFDAPHDLMMKIFKSQGIEFKDVLICPHFAHENCNCRKPKVGLLMDYLVEQKISLKDSYVIGDRETDVQLAHNIKVNPIQFGVGNYQSWDDITTAILNKPRVAEIKRVTNETDIIVKVNLDVPGTREIETGLGFFDHMLDQIVKHAGISATIKAKGDLHIDDHHCVEDVAITLSQTIAQALGDKYGINRYGFLLPMDEALVEIALDLSGRNYCSFEANFDREMVGDLSVELVKHFFVSFAEGLKATLHIKVTGENTHHMIEACFKGLGKVLKQAIAKNGIDEIPSSKGVL
ncbi:bifunctional histidinol-phosphatase/imidazoleglycerol-phosphate dehydratase HisB [Francisella philomiragia]|uniref:Histidine biosynthesis bifunctional protein HisB n=1 Tax=Francisella philomiragia TaxID=28110 RepID=A0AAW3D9U8_9GAMM|nr:bifunctional histidinol-phosphatase/imidazoleglycerol-phosphate dehydratase HisB [Francisella philomiragia]EET21693.1 imidazole glycerol-phosphate dehydratase/histidinol phosphatase [Francisella philomiragia subsp. philomiragia ATCC 25015]KFJ42464.1 histidinol-phosphatase [Francisella philomiragia]MBK2238120.1 bifunctional histidinol-phosphatase/imidazoleglycerol-phosphate dehydratase HisB [Francisella philomiragia]MBK2254200.1 bifunctional histidinol-phosphatase/imidazoleglycerol-phosphate 